MASEVGICNRALQKLGAKRIVSLTDDSVNARACNTAYAAVRDGELRAHPWSFATNRAQLSADSSAPLFGRAASYQLPSTCLRLLSPYPEVNLNSMDWVIEGRKIYTNDSAPLNVRFTDQVTDPNQMDALFREALACKLALEMCEELTQSNTKKADIRSDYTAAIREARRSNAMEKIAEMPPEDTWVTVRN